MPLLSSREEPVAPPPERLGVPVALAAGRVTEWRDKGSIWVHLAGDASILQGADGLRAREALVRISDASTASDKINQLEVYAEGQVRFTGDLGQLRSQYRAVFRAAEIHLRCYDRSAPIEAKAPPRNLAIMGRSGLLRPALASPVMQPQTATRPQQAALTTATTTPASPAPDAAPSLAHPKRDPVVQPTEFVRMAAPDDTAGDLAPAPTDAQVAQARAPRRRGPAQPPIIDLPPIEGAPEVQVPNLRPNPDDLPPDLAPLPGADQAIPVPALPGARPAPSTEPPPEPPQVAPFIPGSQRITSLYPRSGRNLEIRRLPVTPDGVETIICRGGINIVTRTPRSASSTSSPTKP